jgi:RES domain-containing protein
MLVYRIGRTKYANDLTGEGARLNGGRWNHIGSRVIYTSETRALSLLEYTVNVNIDDIPRALSFTIFDIDEKDVLQVKLAQLPGDWRESPAPPSTKDFGTSWLASFDSPVLCIPSSVIPDEFNYLLNPQHPDAKKFKIIDASDFGYDVRIKLK